MIKIIKTLSKFSNIKNIQVFLNFIYFYQLFIKNFGKTIIIIIIIPKKS